MPSGSSFGFRLDVLLKTNFHVLEDTEPKVFLEQEEVGG